MKILVRRDQAVWERETFTVEIPDNTPEEERTETIFEAIDKFDGYGEPDYDISILDGSVGSVDTETEVSIDGGITWTPS